MSRGFPAAKLAGPSRGDVLAQRQNRFDNFRHAFGQSLGEFEQEILGHLKTVAR